MLTFRAFVHVAFFLFCFVWFPRMLKMRKMRKRKRSGCSRPSRKKSRHEECIPKQELNRLATTRVTSWFLNHGQNVFTEMLPGCLVNLIFEYWFFPPGTRLEEATNFQKKRHAIILRTECRKESFGDATTAWINKRLLRRAGFLPSLVKAADLWKAAQISGSVCGWQLQTVSNDVPIWKEAKHRSSTTSRHETIYWSREHSLASVWGMFARNKRGRQKECGLGKMIQRLEKRRANGQRIKEGFRMTWGKRFHTTSGCVSNSSLNTWGSNAVITRFILGGSAENPGCCCVRKDQNVFYS